MSTAKEPTIDFPNTDTTLLLQSPSDKSTTIFICVSSSALSIASPVWKKFLYPPWAAPSTHSSPTLPVSQIECTDDDPTALLLLLRIAHLQFRHIPTILDYSTLLQVAILCDQYACTSLVYPWIESWLLEEEKESKEEGKEGYLFIAWVFGRDHVFEALAKKLVLEIKTGQEGECLTKNGKAMPEPMPNGIIESMLAIRSKTIASLFQIPHTWLSSFESSTKSLCLRTHDTEACDALIYGSVARGLQRASLWPLTNSFDVKLSIEEFAKALNEITIFHMPELRGKNFSYSHVNCNSLNLKVGVKRILEGVGTPVLECHGVHMKAQRGEEM